MVHLWIYFNHDQQQEPKSELEYRLARFEAELARNIPTNDTLNFNRKSVAEHVTAFWISSSLDLATLERRITETTNELGLKRAK